MNGKKLVLGLCIILGVSAIAYPFVRRHVLAAQARERAAEVARDRARSAARSGSIAP